MLKRLIAKFRSRRSSPPPSKRKVAKLQSRRSPPPPCTIKDVKLPSRRSSPPPTPRPLIEYSDELLPRIDQVVPTRNRQTFSVTTAIGRGGYGAVYEVQRWSDDKKFAMKCEKLDDMRPVLHMDVAVMKEMKKRGSKHFTQLIDKGEMPGQFKFVVMQMVGKSLNTLRQERDPQRFTLNTSIKLAEQCLVAIESLHRAGFLNRDIKPDNFAVGMKGKADYHTVFMLDFGLAKPFTNEEKIVRGPREEGEAPFRGSVLYAPIAAHKKKEQSRKDDLESMMYMVVEWTSGALPWNNRTRNWSFADDWVLEAKEKVYLEESDNEVLYKNCPRKQFDDILKYLHGLEYKDIPDYKFIYLTLTSIYTKNRIRYGDTLDWDPETPYHGPQETPGDGTPRPKDQEAEPEVALANKESNSQMSTNEKEANSSMMSPRPTSRTVSTMSSPMKTPQVARGTPF